MGVGGSGWEWEWVGVGGSGWEWVGVGGSKVLFFRLKLICGIVGQHVKVNQLFKPARMYVINTFPNSATTLI